MAIVLTRTGRIFFLTFLITKPPCSVKVNFNPEPFSKACAVVQYEIDQGRSIGYTSWWVKALEMRRKQKKTA
jgi:hypothetical protein